MRLNQYADYYKLPYRWFLLPIMFYLGKTSPYAPAPISLPLMSAVRYSSCLLLATAATFTVEQHVTYRKHIAAGKSIEATKVSF